jgi:hypothetical protein
MSFPNVRYRQHHQGLLLAINLLLGLLLWFFSFTDYSIAGTIPELFFPIIVLVSGFFVLRMADRASTRSRKRLIRLSILPALLGGSLSVSTAVLFVTFSTIEAISFANETIGEHLIQQAASPDRSRVAEVYFRPVGEYSVGKGQIFVRIKHMLLPFVERDVYHMRRTYQVDWATTDHLSWQDNDTLYIPKTQERVHLGPIKAEAHPFVTMALSIYQYISWQAKAREQEVSRRVPPRNIPSPTSTPRLSFEELQTTRLRNIPLYPGPVTSDYSGVWDDNAYRAFDIAPLSLDDAVLWHKEALSRGPWKVLNEARREVNALTARSNGPDHLVYTCLEAERQENDYTIQMYYWTITWSEQFQDARVIVDTPRPRSVNLCEPY